MNQPNHKVTSEDILNLERDVYSARFSDFISEAWPFIDPAPYVHGWHMDALADHLQATTTGDITRLLINVPPGTSKSLATAVLFPAWLWTFRPESKFIGASHSQPLAIRDNRKTRQLIESDWYQSRWPTKLLRDENQKTSFENVDGGFRQACAVTSMTGRRGDCLVGDTIIRTKGGDKSIKDIVNTALPCYVLSYDIHSKKLVYRRVEAVARRKKAEIYRLCTSGGRMVECTGDHLIYTRRGYIKASLLSPGDVLVSTMRSGDKTQRLQPEKNVETRRVKTILQPKMLDNLHEYQKWKVGAILQRLWCKNLCIQWEKAVFEGLRERSPHPRGIMEAVKLAGRSLSRMWQTDKSNNTSIYSDILQQLMQGGFSFTRHERAKQSSVERRRGQCEIFARGYGGNSSCSTEDIEPRFKYMCGLWDKRTPVHASYRHGCDKQQPWEFDNSLHGMPRRTAQIRENEATDDTVAVVERTGNEEIVYDIQVNKTRCFFANGILVHNCVLWDDPLSPELATSDVSRATANRIFSETLPLRLVSPEKSVIIVIMQRLHEDDVSGYIMAGDYGYEHLMLPMEYEPERKCYTSIGFADPRTEDGELLFPERFPRDVVERDKKVMGAYAAAGQYQQRPAPRKGGLFDADNIQVIDTLPANIRWVRAWDLAATEKATAAFTAGALLGVTRGGEYIIGDMKRGQLSPGKVEALLLATATQDGRNVRGSIPQDPGQSGKAQSVSLIKMLSGFDYHASPESGSKEARAMPFAAQVEIGNVKMLRCDWNKDLLDEMRMFPNGKFKDQVDALSRAFMEHMDGSNYTLDNL